MLKYKSTITPQTVLKMNRITFEISNKLNIRRVILLSLILRELLSFWTGHYDFEVFVRVGYHVATGGNPYSYLKYVDGISFLPYDTMTSIGYPPFIALFATFAYLMVNYLSLNRFLYYFLLKQPMILGDITTCFMFYKLFKEIGKTDKEAVSVAAYWAFNPFTIIISSIWGMIDPLVISLLLLSFYYFSKNTRCHDFLAGMLLGTSIFIKQFSVIYIPLFLFAKKRFLEYFLIPLLTAVALIVSPFVVFNWSYEGFYLCMKHQAFEKLTTSEIVILPFSEFLRPFTIFLSMIWLPVLILFYFLSFKLQTSYEAFIKRIILLSIVFLFARIVVSEQLFEYLLAFTLMYYGLTSRGKEFYWSLSFTLLAYLTSNNTLLVRFLSPLFVQAHFWDLYVNNNAPFDTIRSIIRSITFTFVLVTCIDLIFYCFNKKKSNEPFIIAKLKKIRPKNIFI